MPVVEANDLSRIYEISRGLFRVPGRLQAVSGVSFTVEPGRTLAVVGESGCGKSTLARLVTLIERPTAGTLRIDGEIVTNSTIRSRGSGTRNPIKPGLRADFNRKVKSQTFRGFKTLVLDNMYNDASFLREQLAFAVFVCRHDGRMFDTQENNLRRIGLSQQVQTRQP